MNSSPQQETRLWFGVAMVLVGFIVGFALAKVIDTPITTGANVPTAQKSSPAPQAPPAAAALAFGDIDPINASTDHIRGTAGAQVAIIEYSDLQCPYCARVHPTIKQLLDAYPGKVKWIYRHFPLSFHPFAQKAAEATECAAEQGGNDKFWSMVDVIYEKGADTAQLAAYAKDLGLNVSTFTTCLESGKFASKISSMMQGATKAGISGTPGTIIVNLANKKVKVVSGAQPIDNFKAAIDEVLK